ncbi:MAG: hypothetical protein F6K11_26335 [Leptolyngbya sp. SIO3F4]|nr:hypothetical protein [Leptolyngbya sp. SIO3F4]
MKTLLLIFLWAMVRITWELSKHIPTSTERLLSDAEVGLKVEIEDSLNAVVKKWAEA